eukprot:TRINITY_DN7390_c0_g2_i1.p2 TRINITY_DN7390_c0_g2~~TRINITY_DN7390_c0_g2_i1.p2  ORF type:complete len:122 (+),score=17.15 TRINITY_DN7390_c0_g2_i1:1648-2013(+)
MGAWLIQLSCQSRMEWPFPRTQVLPCCRRIAKDLILFQMQNPALVLPENQIGEWRKYLPRNQEAHRDSEVAAVRPSFIKQALLNSFTLRKPRPPSAFGTQTLPQLTILLLFFLGLEDHRKL